MRQFEMQGHWWKPSAPDRAVAGTLTFSDNKGLILSLIGSFDDLIQAFQMLVSPTQLEPILLGFTDDGKRITLTECRLHGSGVSVGSFGGLSRQRFRAEFAFVGAHFNLPEEVCFNRARVGYTYLAEWIGNSGLTYKLDFGLLAPRPSRDVV